MEFIAKQEKENLKMRAHTHTRMSEPTNDSKLGRDKYVE